MNSFGTLFRLHIFGESHGPAVGIVIDNCKPGLAISAEDFITDMNRRRGGRQEGTTSRTEADIPEFLSGINKGYTTGAPLTILFRNENTRSEDYDGLKEIPRPGHADFVAEKKFNGFQDPRGGGHFSGRLTVCLVAAGVIAKKMLGQMAPEIVCTALIKEVGGLQDIDLAIKKAKEDNDSIGGIVECITSNIPSSLGEPFFDSFESVLSHIIFSIPAVKGVEFGSGFSAAKMKGSIHNDMIIDDSGKTASNNAGGISGGITNGNEVVFRVAVKPTSSTPKIQNSYNKRSGTVEEFVIQGRHDLCIALRVPVVVEAVTNIVITDFLLQS